MKKFDDKYFFSEELEKTFPGDLKSGFLPCTPNGCIKLIEKTGVKVLYNAMMQNKMKKCVRNKK